MAERKSSGSAMLKCAWERRKEMRATASKLYAKGNKIQEQLDEMSKEQEKEKGDSCNRPTPKEYLRRVKRGLLFARRCELSAKGDYIDYKAGLVWAEAVIAVYGDSVEMEWMTTGGCRLKVASYIEFSSK